MAPPVDKEPPAKPADSILLRHKRDGYYLALTLFCCVYLFPLDEAKLAFASAAANEAAPTSAASAVTKYLQHHWHWIAAIVIRDLALCTVIYGGYHSLMYEGIGRIAVEATPGAKYNPKWPTAKDISRERFYNYLGWLQCAAYEVVLVHLWASGALGYCSSFFRDEAGALDLQLTAYNVLHIALVPYWRDFHFYFAHRCMHPWWNRKNGLLQGDVGAFLYRHVHSLHHLSHNPGPWSGLAMHPVEHLIYFSCSLLALCFRVHPLCFLFNLFHAAISPMAGHDGLSGDIGGGGFGHYVSNAVSHQSLVPGPWGRRTRARANGAHAACHSVGV
jgi:sterol desaturase/sphingolipid hydroxylase (fatty acid hydroxylase superfamily)